MPDLPTRTDLYSIGRDYIVERATKIDPAQVDVEGSDVNLFVGVVSVVGDACIRQLGYRTAAVLLDGSEDDDLDRFVFDRYQMTRKGASPARGGATFRRPTFLAGAGTIPVGTRCATDTGVEYVTTTVVTFGASDLTSTGNVRAAQAGKATQIGANELRRLADPSQVFDRTITVENALAMAGGEDRESDDLFKERVREFWRSARRGTLGAIEFGALTVPGVVSAQAIETLSDSLPARLVNLYIADSTGISSAALAADVDTALLEYRAGGIAVLISTSIPFIVEIQLRLSFRANVDTLSLTDDVRSAVVEFVNSIPVNGTLYRLQLGAVLQRFVEDGLVLDDSSIVAPAGDLVPTVGQTIRATPASVVMLP